MGVEWLGLEGVVCGISRVVVGFWVFEWKGEDDGLGCCMMILE